MPESTFVNQALIDENTDLEYSIKDNVLIGKPLPDDHEMQTMGNLLLKNINNFPDHVGQINVQTGEKTTFKQFKDRSFRCAVWLKNQGVGKGDVVCTSIPLHNEDYVPVLATLFVGAIISPWPYRLTPLAAEYFFKLVEPKVMFSWDQGIDLLATAAKNAKVSCKFVVVGKHPNYTSLSDLMAEQDQTDIDQFQHYQPEDPKKHVSAYLFTSGTTNNPKVVMLSDEALVKNRFNYMVARTHANLLLYSCLSWNTGLNYFTSSIRKFLTRILHLEFNPEETGAVIQKYKVNLSFLTPTLFTQLYKSEVFKKYDFSTLEAVLVGGNKPSDSILEASRKALPHTQISNTLGMTDANGRLTVQTKKSKTSNSVGRVVGSVQLKIVDQKTGNLLGANEEGEMCFKLGHPMLGYLKNPEESKQLIDEEGWLHSGDLGHYDENGEVWITDRIKFIIIYQGANISPSKIEEILLQHSGVADAAVIPVPHEIDNERPFAFIVKKPGAQVSAEELIELPGSFDKTFRLTGGVAFVNKIPYNTNGKKSIKELKEMAKSYTEK